MPALAKPHTVGARETSEILFNVPGAEVQIEIPCSFGQPLDSHAWDAAQADDPETHGYMWVEAPTDVEIEPIGEIWRTIGAKAMRMRCSQLTRSTTPSEPAPSTSGDDTRPAESPGGEGQQKRRRDRSPHHCPDLVLRREDVFAVKSDPTKELLRFLSSYATGRLTPPQRCYRSPLLLFCTSPTVVDGNSRLRA
ncbi:MAG: hypothetical protein CME06_18465 [Gemmatimonadetes bacterium]|nr:hypothetical protein [Gemmatimonadota bacterium]